MTHILDLLRNGSAFVVVLGILVFVHELGHYLAARWRGVHVEAFSIGFGPALFSWRDKLGTVWKLSLLPLGGYVKLHGQERPEDVSKDVSDAWLPGRTFHAKSVGSRAIVVAAGPIANFLLAGFLFAGLFLAIGRPVTTGVNEPTFGHVEPGSAADNAGLKVGDKVLTIDGQPIEKFEDIRKIVSVNPGKHLALRIQRGAETRDVDVLVGTVAGKAVPSGVLGVRNGTMEYQKVGPVDAVLAGFKQTWDVTAATFGGLTQMLSGKGNTEELSGPLGIAQLSGQVAQLGIASLVSFIAVLSVNLGLINLFPIPVLDGGHLLFYFFEAVRRRPLPARFQEYGFRAGFALLAGLFVFATWNDLTHMGVFRWVSGLFG